MNSQELTRKVGIVTEHLLETCPDPHEALTVLMHVAAGAFAAEKTPPEDVVAYLVTITNMLDGKFSQ